MASAKLAKSTVNHSQSVICREKPTVGSPKHVANQQNRGQGGAHFHHEHNRVLSKGDGVQLDERIFSGPPHQLGGSNKRARAHQLLRA